MSSTLAESQIVREMGYPVGHADRSAVEAFAGLPAQYRYILILIPDEYRLHRILVIRYRANSDCAQEMKDGRNNV